MELKDLCRNGACSAVAASVQTMHLVGLKPKRTSISKCPLREQAATDRKSVV